MIEETNQQPLSNEPRSHWDYRVIKFEDPNDVPFFIIHEVYYKGDKPVSYAEHGAHVCWSQGEDPQKIFVMMQKALSLPVLNVTDFC